MKPFCEVVVVSVLPAIRSMIARELVTTYGLNQKEAAKLLGLTQPAISQYIRESRGYKVKLLEQSPKVSKMIDDLVKDIVDEKIDAKEVQDKFCEICKTVRKKKLICDLHEKIYPSIAPCDICSVRLR